MTVDRRRLQVAFRVAALAFVVAWLFSRPLQRLVPPWVPFAVLLAAELEFLARAWHERRAPAAAATADPAERRAPGADDADLGWGRVVEDDEGVYYVPPPARTPRPRYRPLLTITGVLLASVLFVIAWRVERDRTWQALTSETQAGVERRLSVEASAIAGRPVTVRCDDGYSYTGIGSDALGVAFITRGLAFLQPSVCRALHDLVDGDRRVRDVTGEAVLVLAHEAVHLAGERDEGLTECRGLQEGVPLGVRLGLAPESARRLMADRYRRNLADRSITRLNYRLPPGCRDGGPYDLRPENERFP